MINKTITRNKQGHFGVFVALQQVILYHIDMKMKRNIKLVLCLFLYTLLNSQYVYAQDNEPVDENQNISYISKNDAYRYYIENYGNILSKTQIHELLDKSGCYKAKESCHKIDPENFKEYINSYGKIVSTHRTIKNS